MTPAPEPCPRPAARLATCVPCAPPPATGVWPSADPVPERSVPPTTAPRKSGIDPSTPLSSTAILTPAPLDTVHALVMPSAPRYHCPVRTESAAAGRGEIETRQKARQHSAADERRRITRWGR